MTTINYTKSGWSRNNNVPSGLSLGGLQIWLRTHWSVSLCNAVAVLAGIGSEG